MILILTTQNDPSSSEVIEWLLHLNKKFIRINYEDVLSIDLELSSKSCIIVLNSKQRIDLQKCSGYWYRRGNFNFPLFQFKEPDKSFKKVINRFNSNETNTLSNFIHSQLRKKRSLNSFKTQTLNKLDVLYEASSFGLLVPQTLVTHSKETALDFYHKHKNIISKPLNNGFSFELDSNHFYLHTIRITLDDLGGYPSNFAATLFQKEIKKAFELRIFYLKGVFYSSAIFSQGNKKTEVDFRNYDLEKPNRVLPYQLPKSLESKLKKLMLKLNLESGSIDMIVTPINEFYFLEVNPVGQFAHLSENCNYYLEEKIAKTL